LLVGLFGDDAEHLLQNIRNRGRPEEDQLDRVEKQRADRIREIIQLVQETGIGEVTIEEAGMRVSVRATPDVVYAQPVDGAPLAIPDPEALPVTRPANGLVRIESPMVGTFYRAPSPDQPAFVEEGDIVAAGQTLCILEAMKLMNEVKSELEAVVRKIHVGNAQPVEFGQVLFDLEPLAGPPVLLAFAAAIGFGSALPRSSSVFRSLRIQAKPPPASATSPEVIPIVSGASPASCRSVTFVTPPPTGSSSYVSVDAGSAAIASSQIARQRCTSRLGSSASSVSSSTIGWSPIEWMFPSISPP
jgi:acetyl-CoA carboxylase biotin carboxyl carrier protein